eukprot:4722870-Prorocentrum_lima.AAC.1
MVHHPHDRESTPSMDSKSACPPDRNKEKTRTGNGRLVATVAERGTGAEKCNICLGDEDDCIDSWDT